MELLFFIVNGFWEMLAVTSGWRPDPVLKGQLETVAAVFGVIGGGFTVYKTVHRMVTGRSITEKDTKAVAGEVMGNIDDKLNALIEQRLDTMLRNRMAETGTADAGSSSDDVEHLKRDALAGVIAVERESGAIGREAAQVFIETGDLAPTRAALKERALRLEADSNEARQEVAATWRQLGALTFLNDTNEALSAYRKSVDLDPDNAEGWNRLGNLLDRVGDLDASIVAYEKVLMLSNKMSGREATEWQAIATGNLGLIYFTRGDLEKAEENFNRVLALNEELGRKEALASTYINLSGIYKTRGELRRAEAMLNKALALNEELGRKVGMAASYANLGLIYSTRGKLVQAEEILNKALATYKELDSKEGMASTHVNLGSIYFTSGDLGQAEVIFNKALALHEELGNKQGIAKTYTNLGIIYSTRGDFDQAEAMQKKALALYEELGSKEGTAASYVNLGLIYGTCGDLDRAEMMLKKALALNEKLGRKEGVANAYVVLGNIYGARGDLDEAEEMQKKSLAINQELGRREGMAASYANLARIQYDRGDLATACLFWHKAHGLYTKIGMLHMVRQIEEWLGDSGCSEA